MWKTWRSHYLWGIGLQRRHMTNVALYMLLLMSVSLFPGARAQDIFRVAVLGSSTAEGEAARPLGNSWANRFREHLATVYSSSELINLAIGGFTTFNSMPDGYVRPAPWDADNQLNVATENNITKAISYNPSIVLINFPSNDCDLYIPVAQQLSNLDAMMYEAESRGIAVYISTTQPRNSNEAVRALLMEMRDAITSRYSGKVMDFWTGLGDADGTILPAYDYDGTHFNNEGHSILFERVRSVVYLPPLPIQLASFQARVSASGTVVLQWSTLSEIDNYGFEIQKSPETLNDYGTIEGSFVAGHGTTNEIHHYSYTDTATSPGVWYYRLMQIDLGGPIHFSEGIRQDVLLARVGEAPMETLCLGQNYPNPFNPSTTIKYELPAAAVVRLSVFDMLGREVSVLVNERNRAGVHTVRVDGSYLASGAYVYRLQAGDFVSTKKMLVLE
jgi:lysophospholipase L1-like esterase